MAPRISVVIPTLAKHDRLPLALDRLEDQLGGHALEVIVVRDADAAGDELVEPAISERPYPVQRLRATTAGASAARNLGWRAAAADLILFIGDDILASPNLVDEHVAWHERHQSREVGVLGHVRWARRPRPTKFMRWLERGIQTDYGSIRDERAGWWHLYTTNVSLKRSMLELVRGFDESQPFLYEDLDLGKRMAEHGFSLLYNPAAWAEHLHPTTLDDWRRRMAMVARAERRFVGRHPELPAYFHEMFSQAAAAPRARGLAARLAWLIPPGTPRLGARVWGSMDRMYRQALAPAFLESWDAAEEAADETDQEASGAARAASSSGSSPGGP